MNPMRRRDLLIGSAAAAAATALAQNAGQPVKRKGRIKQSAMLVNFDAKLSFDQMCRITADAGCVGMDLIPPQDWPTLKKYGLIPTTAPRIAGISREDGIIQDSERARMEPLLRETIDTCAAGGARNMIVIGGMKHGKTYEQGADIVVDILNKVKSHAEDKNVNMVLEIMNSRIDRPDQVFDHMDWGINVIKRINSPRVRILFDIYHVQVMDGDLAHHIRDDIQYIGHFHTGGSPGRHEIGDNQEINYHFLAQVIADTGYDGYVAHEYELSPGHDSAVELNKAVALMDV